MGGAEGTRTPDPHTASVVRYQLRHSPMALPNKNSRPLGAQLRADGGRSTRLRTDPNPGRALEPNPHRPCPTGRYGTLCLRSAPNAPNRTPRQPADLRPAQSLPYRADLRPAQPPLLAAVGGLVEAPAGSRLVNQSTESTEIILPSRATVGVW